MGGFSENWRVDIIAGLSVAGLMLPEAVAYAGIAGLPPGRAIIAAIAGGLAYALIGRSRLAIIAPTSSSAAILAAALAALSAGGADRAMLATALVAVAGAAFVVMATVRMGSVAAFISRPVLRGFALGLAVTIIAKQLPALLGLELHAPDLFALLAGLPPRLGDTHVLSLAVGGGALALLLVLRRWPQVPGALVVLMLGILISLWADLPAHGVAPVGPVALAWALPRLPDYDLDQWSRVVQLALPLTLLLFAESWGTMRALALRRGDTLSADRELLALGGANLCSAALGGMPVGAGFSAGSANAAAGATGRLSALAAIWGLAAMVLVASPVIAHLPQPVLAAVVIAALVHALNPAPIARLFRLRRDPWIALAATAGVIALGVLNGMLVAVALSLLALLSRLARPVVSELGRLGDGHDFVDLAVHARATRVPGVAIFRPNAPLFFANADAALEDVERRAVALAAGTCIVLSLEESDDLDSSALEAIDELQRGLAEHGQMLRLARLHDRARAVLNAAAMTQLAASAGFSVADAVDLARREQSENVDAQ
ncbi:SulP family inorganic anion transporter [Sphingomonas sp.]|uniref:SulP family inorganic anion transporter n=1 Tax=Sphingomonas sp. TaxID=28214 RepID=UPI001DBE0BCF|nr:SulP family inorganic anion transporter [Sphingomonas sp.]MBX9796629.1 STAS domain-containing protein [Sphingomonas sp.]